jgi:hypothetical protein
VKQLTINQLCDQLELEDEVTVLELLDLNSFELVGMFKHRVSERKDYLLKYYEEVTEKETPYRKQTDATRLGSREVWEAAGFDCEDENY